MLRIHCIPVCPHAQNLDPRHKKCFWCLSETFCVRSKCFQVCAACTQNICFVLCPARLPTQETLRATMCPQHCRLVCHHNSIIISLSRLHLRFFKSQFCDTEVIFLFVLEYRLCLFGIMLYSLYLNIQKRFSVLCIQYSNLLTCIFFCSSFPFSTHEINYNHS